MSLTRVGQALSTGLGVASWGRWCIAMGVAVAISSAAAFWVGARWERGAQALSEASAQRSEIADLRQAARDIKQAGVDAAASYREAAQRQEDIAHEWQQGATENRDWFARHARSLDDTLAGLPAGVRGCDGGERVRDHWNAASQRRAGDAAEPAAAADRGGAVGAVRADAAGAGRALRDPGADARRGDGRAPPLR